MHIKEVIEARRAVKQFDANATISDTQLEELIAQARLTPTAFNLQHYRLVVVKDPDLRQKIREVSWNQSQVTDAAALIIVCGDLDAWKTPMKTWQGAPADYEAWLTENVQNYYQNNPEVQRDETFRSCGMISQTLMLAATGMGFDTCPMDGFDFDAVAKLINLPERYAICMFVAVGKRKEDPRPRPPLLELNELVTIDQFDE